MDRVTGEKVKHRHIYEILHQSILRGDYQKDERIPTETDLAKQFSTSRPTVARALARLRKEGLIERRPGSGTYVRYADKSRRILSFGLLIPGLGETEIFEPICGHMAEAADENGFRLIWSGSMSESVEDRQRHIECLAQRYVQEKVDGVFFSPLELTTEKDTINTRIVQFFDEAGIPVVLMDRDVVSFPLRSKYDLVSVDNLRIGYIMAQHLIEHGCTRLKFVARPYSAPTVRLRALGYEEAVRKAGLKPEPDGSNAVNIGDVEDQDFLRKLVQGDRTVGIVCANDTTAARLMHHVSEMGYDIPGQVRVVGIDDVKYARFLRVPLTTYRQPLKNIASVAIEMMLARVSNPKTLTRTVCLDGELVIRRSCGCV